MITIKKVYAETPWYNLSKGYSEKILVSLEELKKLKSSIEKILREEEN